VLAMPPTTAIEKAKTSFRHAHGFPGPPEPLSQALGVSHWYGIPRGWTIWSMCKLYRRIPRKARSWSFRRCVEPLSWARRWGVAAPNWAGESNRLGYGARGGWARSASADLSFVLADSGPTESLRWHRSVNIGGAAAKPVPSPIPHRNRRIAGGLCSAWCSGTRARR